MQEKTSKQIAELNNKLNTLLTELLGKKYADADSNALQETSMMKKRTIDVAPQETISSDFELASRSAPLSSKPSASASSSRISTIKKTTSPLPDSILYSTSPLVYKTPVPESKKSWDVNYVEYNPKLYTSAQVLNNESADSDLITMWEIF